VSLLSTEHLSIFLSPTELAVVHSRGISKQIVEKRVYPVTSHDDHDWAGAVEVLGNVLRETTCRCIRIILSCHFTQYQLVPWRADLNDSDEELAVVRLSFNATFGESVAGWSIRLSDEPPGVPRVAAAVHNGLLGSIEQTAAATRTRVLSIQPYLAAATNSWCSNFRRDRSTWLILHEECRACMAFIECGRWRWVRCVRVGDDWVERLPELVEYEIMLAGTDAAPVEVLVFAPSHPVLTVRAGARLPFRSLRLAARPGYSPMSDSQFGFALIG
jgi:hypothetical protein